MNKWRSVLRCIVVAACMVMLWSSANDGRGESKMPAAPTGARSAAPQQPAAKAAASQPAAPKSTPLGNYVILGWNDLGMHCMNRYYSNLCILPPFNNVWTQVIQRGNPPRLITQNVALSYRFPANTDSAGKVDFWQHSQQLFGVSLADNVGLTGHGLTGAMEYKGTSWEVTGVPLTPFDDAAPTVEQPYQLAEVTCRNADGTTVLDQTSFVAPVSTEIHCDNCHGAQAESNILKKHDEENGTTLQSSRPVLCASCHASNALGTTGNPNLPNLSRAIHKFHGEEAGANTDCYNCHPGTQTKCLRGAMFLAGKKCTDCHGNMLAVGSSTRRPWIDEPRCATCHPNYQPRDAVQALRVQGKATYIKDCYVCHTSRPQGAGPHGVFAPSNSAWSLH